MSKTFFISEQHFFHPEPELQRAYIFPVFLPFAGCGRRCIFCAQDVQTGKTAERIADILPRLRAEVLRHNAERSGKNKKYCIADRPAKGGVLPELAFFGGTFTALPENDLAACLETAALLQREGHIASARCSTRPDALSPEMLFRLRSAGFTTIELGIQSFHTAALREAGRGYTAETAVAACRMVQDAGLRLGIQLMPGMPGLPNREIHTPTPVSSTPVPSVQDLWKGRPAHRNSALAAALEDVAKAAALKPDIVRLYPCLVFEGTALAELWRQGRYVPLSVEETVLCLAEACRIFWRAGVRVVRMGVAPEAGLEAGLLAGPAHPALGSRARGLALFSFIAEQCTSLFPEHAHTDDTSERFPLFRLTAPRRCQGELFGHCKELLPLYESIGIPKEHIHFHEHPAFLLRLCR